MSESSPEPRELRSFWLWYRISHQIVGDVLRGKASYRTIAGRCKGPIFCIGRNKTGTTSLATALCQLGYRVAPQAPAELLLRDWSRADFRRLLVYSRVYDAYQDVPFSYPGTFKVLDQAFPNARFVLTVRDSADEWYHSLVRFHSKLFGVEGQRPTADDLKRAGYRYRGFMWDTARLLYGVDGNSLYDYDIYTQHYERHNQEAVDYFAGCSEKLLVLNVKEKDGLKRLGDFLGKEIESNKSFPWENKT